MVAILAIAVTEMQGVCPLAVSGLPPDCLDWWNVVGMRLSDHQCGFPVVHQDAGSGSPVMPRKELALW